jgi:hypothetical protein
MARPLEEIADEMRNYINRKVAAAFDAPKDIVDLAVGMVSDDAEASIARPLAEQFMNEALTAHQRAQETWPATTDCDRLDAAFSELTRNGIVCRQDFTCCGTCGVAEIGDEIMAETLRGTKVRGYAFYHMQNTDRATEGLGLLLTYSALVGGKPAGEEIGREIVAVLQRHELTTEWNGSFDNCIKVKLDWKRRRPARATQQMTDRRPRPPNH